MNTQAVFKIGSDTIKLSFEHDKYIKINTAIGPDEMGETKVELPTLESPRFIVIMVDEGYEDNGGPVDVMFNSPDGEPRSCTPVAVFTANVSDGMEGSFNGITPTLYFRNWTGNQVGVKIIAGE